MAWDKFRHKHCQLHLHEPTLSEHALGISAWGASFLHRRGGGEHKGQICITLLVLQALFRNYPNNNLCIHFNIKDYFCVTSMKQKHQFHILLQRYKLGHCSISLAFLGSFELITLQRSNYPTIQRSVHFEGLSPVLGLRSRLKTNLDVGARQKAYTN